MLTAFLVLALPAMAGAAPAVDEYGANLPTAGGQKSQGAIAPQAHPEQLPPSIAKRLNGSADGKKLSAVATAPELGAPQDAGKSSAGSSDDGNGDGFLTAAGGTLSSPLVLLLVAALALSAVAAWRVRRGTPS